MIIISRTNPMPSKQKKPKTFGQNSATLMGHQGRVCESSKSKTTAPSSVSAEFVGNCNDACPTVRSQSRQVKCWYLLRTASELQLIQYPHTHVKWNIPPLDIWFYRRLVKLNHNSRLHYRLWKLYPLPSKPHFRFAATEASGNILKLICAINGTFISQTLSPCRNRNCIRHIDC